MSDTYITKAGTSSKDQSSSSILSEQILQHDFVIEVDRAVEITANLELIHFSKMGGAPPAEMSNVIKPKRRVAKRTGTVRRRTGCLTCRSRRKKCDEVYPICGHCTRLNLVCKRETPRSVLTDEPSTSTTEADAAPATASTTDSDAANMMVPRAPPAMDITSIMDARQGSSKRFFMKYYVQILANLLTTNQENNSFLSIFIPMSVDSDAVQNALMAWSSTHLSRFDSSYTVPALEYQSHALNAVATSLVPSSQATEDPQSTLAATLILCSIEVSLGDTTGRWYDHLLGARFIIQNARSIAANGKVLEGAEHFMKTMDGQWLLSDFAYHDVLGSVALGKPPLLRGPHWLNGDANFIDPYAGVGSQILSFISEISCLPESHIKSSAPLVDERSSRSPSADMSTCSNLSDETRPDDLEREFSTRARLLERALKEWEPPQGGNRPIKSLALAYRASALIYLYRKVRSFVPAMTEVLNKKIAVWVADVLDHVKDIPVTSLPECALPFPLFLAGGDTMDPEQTRCVRDRLQGVLDHRGFGNIQSILDVLDELWRLKSSGQRGPTGAPVDWMDVVCAKDWKLALF